MPHTHNLLQKLLKKGDVVSIDNGRLSIIPASGKSIPNDWLEENSLMIIKACINQVGINAYTYEGYTTGHYGDGKHEGLTLTFTNLNSGTSAFACFNANLKRQRNIKGNDKGKALPIGQFSVPKKGAFYKFWVNSGLQPPASTTRFYECMGKLSHIIFEANLRKSERLDNPTIVPLNITYERLFSPHKNLISNSLVPHKKLITLPHKESEQPQAQQGLEPKPSTGENKYSNKVIREHGYKGNDITPLITPKEQSIDDWLNDLSSIH